MKIIQGVLFAVLAGVFVLGSLVQLMGGGLARLADDLYGRLEEW